MKSALKYFSCLMLIIVITCCKKFLNVRPNDIAGINPRTVTDFEEMLNSSTLTTQNYFIADLISDDISLSENTLTTGGKNSFYVNAYLWDNTVWTLADNDPMYNGTYRSILQMNIILDNINKAHGGTVERKDIVTAQAKINRAFYYLQLVNLYGAAYQTSSAGKDLGVPLILYPDASVFPKRNTVKQVYDQILADLNDAVNTTSLPEFGSDVIHPGKASAVALLARTYLYMGDYERALVAAESALKFKSTLLDYRNFSFSNPANPSAGIKNKPFTLKDQEQNPEILFTRVFIDADFISMFKETPYCSKELQELFGTKDLRFVYGFSLKPGATQASYLGYNNDNIESMQFNYSFGVPEMMLIKAECLARKGGDVEAIELLNKLRQHRYNIQDYVPLQITTGTDVLKLVVEERRRELFLHGGLRLFDLKRLNKELRFKKDMQRISMADGSILATILSGSPRYLIPFAPKIVANNPLIVQNER